MGKLHALVHEHPTDHDFLQIRCENCAWTQDVARDDPDLRRRTQSAFHAWKTAIQHDREFHGVDHPDYYTPPNQRSLGPTARRRRRVRGSGTSAPVQPAVRLAQSDPEG